MSVYLRDTLDEMEAAAQAALPKEERDKKILEKIFSILCDRLTALIGKPFRLIFDSSIGTASTDCIAEVRISPWFFTEGHTEVGFGTGYHETGHIKFSPYGVKLLTESYEFGGDVLQNIMNLILDRKDDLLTARHAPGFADTLRKRLAYISTMTRRQELASTLSAYTKKLKNPSALHEKISKKDKKYRTQKKTTEEEITAFLKNWKPSDAYEDFFFAAKWHKRARIRKVHKAMKFLSPKKLLDASPDYLLWAAQEIHAILGDPDEKEKEQGKGSSLKKLRREFEQKFIALCLLATSVELGEPVDPELLKNLNAIMAGSLKVQRNHALNVLVKWMRSMRTTYPQGAHSVGREHTVPVKNVPSNGIHAPAYQRILATVQHLVGPLVRKLKRLENPSEYTLYGQDEGELDTREVARIATGLSGFRKDIVEERNIDAEIHLCIDRSGSMTGEKIEQAKQIAVLFSEAIMALRPACEGHIWAFSSRSVYDYGPPSRMSSFVKIDGEDGNSDTHMLTIAAKKLRESKRKRKVLIMLCDDGPDDLKLAARISRELKEQGIIVIHMFIGVHGTPNVYPTELLFSTMEDCLNSFGDILETVVKNLK